MKLHSKFLVLALALVALASLNSGFSTCFAQGTAFTYQGRLNNGTNPVTGIYDLKFYLYNDAAAGSVVAGPITNSAVAVTNGLFTTALDFGGVFDGTALWLHVGVRTNGSGAFNGLLPRQPLTPAPYAVFAEGANAAGLTGTIPAADFSGIYGSAVSLNNAGNSFTGNGGGLTGLNASQLTLGTVPDARLSANVALLNATQTFTGANSFSGNISLLDPTKTIVFPATGGVNSPMMEMFASGTGNANRMVIAHSPGFQNWGLGYEDYVDRFNFLAGGTAVLSVNLGYQTVGIGVTNPASKLEVAGDVRIDGSELYLKSTADGVFASDGLVFGNGGLPGINYLGQGPFLAGYYGGSLGGLAPNVVALSWDASGDVQVSNNLNTATMTVRGNGSATPLSVIGKFATVSGLGNEQAYIGGDGAGGDVQIGSLNSAIDAVAFYNATKNTYMHIYCSSITIEGGADLAEPFKMTSGKNEIPEGAVVVIDEQNPGHLKMSDAGYDTHVAGVVSGANGINPGIQMQQKGALEGGKNVALTGRVYVQADTSNGIIKPGDLLTTSSQPGHAMKVTDHVRAAGAILGKAMTALNDGSGMVLVLVTLQ